MSEIQISESDIPSSKIKITSENETLGFVDEEIQIVEFISGNEHYAINLFDVREVVEYTRITRVPNTHRYMRGIIDLRGEIMPVIDLGVLLHSHDMNNVSEKEENCRFIVLDEHVVNKKVCIMVTDVLSVSTFSSSQVDTGSTCENEKTGHILGIIRKELRNADKISNALLIWINIASLLHGIEINSLR
ncbi:chemotaxis protein CheW [Methanospirillum lacunae]|uniref:Chemotaxis protein CheW n=1 Tax=Methanospirillum lacunae TaxID=668570 RepID=A0A2V2N3Z3_9EURY|nr:chemotaxis protein CheW [Methanospirillum lacunae]PWR74519.1 chemotaxis protein CheW [Methanospirillum lacunae]